MGDPTDARTWSDAERAIYDVGYREGGASNQADWDIALSELLGDDFYTSIPSVIRYLEVSLKREFG